MTDKPSELRTVRLIATGKFKHHGRDLKTNDEFEATEAEAEELCCSAIGLATRAPRNTYRRRDLKAE